MGTDATFQLCQLLQLYALPSLFPRFLPGGIKNNRQWVEKEVEQATEIKSTISFSALAGLSWTAWSFDPYTAFGY